MKSESDETCPCGNCKYGVRRDGHRYYCEMLERELYGRGYCQYVGQSKGLKLWTEWFGDSEDGTGNPLVPLVSFDTEVVELRCFFCKGDADHHAPDCIYMRAKKLVEGGR